MLERPLVYQAFRRTSLAIQARLNDFDPIVYNSDARIVDDLTPPLFLFSPPRVGSTLVYQYISTFFRLAYISNLMALAPRYMLRLCRIAPRTATGHARMSKDYYGFISGLLAPSEALKVVQKWFLGNDWLDRAAPVRGTVATISEATGSPFFYKNPSLSPCIDRLLTFFPKARLIFLTRDVRFVAQSILLARDFLSLDIWKWWSIELPGQSEIRCRPLPYQAAWQAWQTTMHLEGIARLWEQEPFRVRYEEFCQDPHYIACRIGERFGLDARPRVCEKLPRSFPVSARIRVAPDTWSAIEDACEELGIPKADRNWPVTT
jgi:hypothetical protein